MVILQLQTLSQCHALGLSMCEEAGLTWVDGSVLFLCPKRQGQLSYKAVDPLVPEGREWVQV